MRRPGLFVLASIMVLLGVLTIPVYAQAGIRILRDRAALQFPESVTFSVEVQSGASINSVVLEYGVDQLTCGTVVAQAFPQFTPSADVQVSWTWEMRQSGSLPPGARLWWHWQVTDAGGRQYTSPKQTVTWLDDQHRWQTLTGGNINLHWYSGGAAFGHELHDSAAQALARLTQDIGVSTDQPVDLYIYADTQDMQDAILYEPSWTGGEAFPENDIVIIGISPSELDWGKSTEAHELTHVLVGHETFSCLGFIPTWLNEGLAVYGEGGPDPSMQATFETALAGNTLSSVRALSGNFPESADQANLAYGESFSIVSFLIKNYGRDKMNALLQTLSDGDIADQALQKVYGFDVDGLEDAWRASIGAPSRSGSAQPTPVPTPTIVPTIVPVSSSRLAASTPAQPSTAAPALATQVPGPDVTPLPLIERLGLRGNAPIIVIGLVACLIVLGLAALILILVRRRSRRPK